jgi:hypothetical protein
MSNTTDVVLLTSIIKKRKFELSCEFQEPVSTWTRNVLKYLEGKKVAVPGTKKKGLLPAASIPYNNEDYDDNKHREIHHNYRRWLLPGRYHKKLRSRKDLGLTHISILKWLPVVCSSIHFRNDGEHTQSGRTVGICKTYISEIIDSAFRQIPQFMTMPGYIELDEKLAGSEKAFCFILAHEFFHAIQALQVYHPATMDWNGFKENILDTNHLKREDFGRVNKTGVFKVKLPPDEDIDFAIKNNDTEEVEILQNIFGSIIDGWFDDYVEFSRKGINNAQGIGTSPTR